MPEYIQCPYCKQWVPVGHPFCIYCHEKLDSAVKVADAAKLAAAGAAAWWLVSQIIRVYSRSSTQTDNVNAIPTRPMRNPQSVKKPTSASDPQPPRSAYSRRSAKSSEHYQATMAPCGHQIDLYGGRELLLMKRAYCSGCKDKNSPRIIREIHRVLDH